MQFENVSVKGMGYIDAPIRVESAEIEAELADSLAKFDMRPNLIRELSGIHARRFWEPGHRLDQSASEVAELALADAGVPREEVGLLINTSVSKDFIEPSTASLVAGNLGLAQHTINFDVSNACLGFVNGMEIAGYMIERGQIDHALIVCAENTRIVNEQTMDRLTAPNVTEKEIRDNFASLTLGSGAVAMVISRSELAPEGHRVLGGYGLSATQHSRLCLGDITMSQMVTDASSLLKAGIGLIAQTWPHFLEEVDWNPDTVDMFAVHQVSAPHTRKMADLVEIDMDKIYLIFPEYGNMGPVGMPVSIAKAHEEGNLSKGDHIAMFGVGSGLNCSMLAVEW